MTQPVRRYTTKEVAAITRLTEKTVRKNLEKVGHFKGIKPIKLPGGRLLLWPADQIDLLISGEPIEATANAR